MSSSENQPGTPPSGSSAVPSRLTDTQRVQDALDAVQHFLKVNGPQPGSIISAYLQSARGFQPRDYGFGSLTEFMKLLSPPAHVISFRGTDRVWQLGDFTGPKAPRTAVGGAIWRALASPNSQRQVLVQVHTGSGRWRIRSRPDSPVPDSMAPDEDQLELQTPHGEWRTVPPMPAASHERVARSFVKRSDLGSLGTALGALVGAENWWILWRHLLEPRPELLQSWFDARDKELRRYIRTTLAEFGLRDDLLDRALETPAPDETPYRSRVTAYRLLAGTTVEVPTAVREAQEQLWTTGDTLRGFVLDVVAKMTDEELAALHLPLRAVYEASRRR